MINLADTKKRTYILRISAKKTPLDNPYYYSNERLSKCLHVMEQLRADNWPAPDTQAEALTLRVTSIVGLEGGYRAACGDDACRVDVSVCASRQLSAHELEQTLKPLAELNGVCITVLDRGEYHVE